MFLDVIVQSPKTKIHPKVKLSDVSYHKIDDVEHLNIKTTYDDLVLMLKEFVKKLSVPESDDDKAFYEIISLPVSTIFGRSEPRKTVNARMANRVMPITSDYLSQYIDYCGFILKEKKVRKALGEGRKRKEIIIPSRVGIDLAVIVRIVEPTVNTNNTDFELSTVNISKSPTFKKKKVKHVYIPRKLQIGVLNPTMSVKNGKECSIVYTTSSVTPIGSVTFDLTEYIDTNYDNSCGKLL